MGFLDLYTGTITVDLGNDYKVEIKKFLSNEDYTAANKALMTSPILEAGGVKAAVDINAYNNVLVLRAIESWNLTDNSDSVMPVNADSIAKLPQSVFVQILQSIEDQNKERSPAEQGQFLVKS